MRKPSQAETASEAGKKLPEKAANGKRLQRQQQRGQERLREHLEAQACGARWLPLVQRLLRRSRGTARDTVWTAHMRHKLALREKKGVLARRVKATTWLRSLFTAYKAQHDVQARDAILRGYMRLDHLREMLHGYRIVRYYEVAKSGLEAEPSSSCLELSPLGRRLSSCRHMNECTPPDDRGVHQRAENRPKKTRGGRSRRR